eukprot:11170175-Lingulodinium_polyedra.AAC.1
MFIGLQAPPEQPLVIEPEVAHFHLETDAETAESGQVGKYKGTCERAGCLCQHEMIYMINAAEEDASAGSRVGTED